MEIMAVPMYTTSAYEQYLILRIDVADVDDDE
jgi:hypothetical protein